jgi:hypothetical protein
MSIRYQSRSNAAAAPQQAGRITSTASTTCSGNGSWVSHSSTASHQSARARATAHTVPGPDPG